jgi:hypothetical protein
MAAPPSDTPTVTIDRLKGGEINWSLKTPAPSVGAAITRALEQAQRLIEGCMELEQLERGMRAKAKAAAQEKAEEAGQ